jgi:hypothetical protein
MFVPTAKEAFFPLDSKWGLNASAYSLEMGRQITWLSGLLPFEQCQAVFWELGKRLIPRSSIWRQSQYYGAKLWDFAQREAEQVRVERIVLPDAREDHEQKKGLSMDGGMVNVRGEGWREVKVAAVFDIELKLERDPHTEILGDYAHACKIHYRAILGTKQDFAAQAWALAVKYQVPTAQERLVIGDGAAWIWSLAEDLCPDGWQIVDWFHASQHLAQAAQKAFPAEEQAQKRQHWLKHWLDHLYFGRIETLLEELETQNCHDFLNYFETHKRRMQYLEFRENALPLGSGVIESGVKQVKQRVAAAGMRWNAQSLNPMLLIAGSVLAHDFHELWHEAISA